MIALLVLAAIASVGTGVWLSRRSELSRFAAALDALAQIYQER